MAVLSFSSEHEAGATIVHDGKVLAAVNEERFSRVKNQDGFPHRSIESVLKIAGLSAADIEHVIIPEISKLEDFFKNVILKYPTSLFMKGGSRFPGVPDAFKQMFMSSYIVSKAYLRVGLDHYMDYRRLKSLFPGARFHRVEHHLAHASAPYFTCEHDKALIISSDYWGDFACVMVSIAQGEKVKVVSRSFFPHSPGHYYASITKWMGFRANRHEGKIVGLAAYGDAESPAYDEIKDMFVCDGLKIIAPYMIGKMWHHKMPVFKNCMMKRLKEKYSREDLAAVFQRRFEEVFVELVRNCFNKYHIENLLLVGGSFANVKLNQRVFEVDGIKSIYVFPNMSDGGISAGAALNFDICDNGGSRNCLQDVYFGPAFSDREMEEALDEQHLTYTYERDIEKKIAKLLMDKKVVARFDGRMEFGPRALGNRSILYTAEDPTVNDWLNKKLKRTEFMPFAPVTLSDHAHECYQNLSGAEYTARFMTITFDCTDYMKKASPATVHVDGTARPQLISKEQNPGYFRILEEYFKLTGIPSIINTSFNMHEEPIVCSPRDAVRSFMQGHLDYLAMGRFLVNLNEQRKN
ncbi:MAG: carbamoyltransferase C-terminal domain-containing protein [candidate division KSB1 bacterium]|jgi:carbamoyltransferase|nr:carbamoyltransferase C-terminal domain-containing protein [candidate division KSB1 bacterium]